MTHQKEIERQSRDAWDRLGDVVSKLPELFAALTDAQPGFSSGRAGSSSEPSSMPERLAARWVGGGQRPDGTTIQPAPDDALSDRALFERTTAAIHKSVVLLEQVANRWTTTEHRKPEDTPEIWCSNHLQYQIFEPRGIKHGARCAWCAGFYNDHKFEAPQAILEYRRQHGRVTTAMIERHRPAPKAKGRKKGKGKGGGAFVPDALATVRKTA